MRVITLATIKGGVGKTVLACHLAAALADKGVETLLVDLDPQGHASLVAGLDADPDAPCVGDVLLPKGQSLSNVIVPVRERLSVAPAVLRMAVQERQLYAWALRLSSLARALGTVEEIYDAVIVDTPPHIGAFTEAALHAAHLTIAPIPALAGALQGFGDLRETWKEMQDGRNGRIVGVINLLDRRTSATNAAVSSELAEMKVPLLKTRIPRAEVINQAALGHELVFDASGGSLAKEALRGFAVEAWRKARRIRA